MDRLPSASERVAGEVLRPDPIRTDASNAFAHYSMKERVPRILAQVLADDPALPERSRGRVQRLIDAIVGNEPMAGSPWPSPDDAEWQAATPAPMNGTWLASPWLFAECNVYRQLLAACRYWETGRDPFIVAKQRELASAALWQAADAVDELAELPARARLAALLAMSLWGNRVDLSYAVGTAFGRAGGSEDWLVDDRASVIALAGPGEVHIVTDNAGTELVMDLALAESWLHDFDARVTLHVKMHPTFVSDATVADVWTTVAAMHQRGQGTSRRAERLEAAFARDQLRVVPDFFWNGPRFLWELPPRLAREFERATLVVAKGDANYRRVVGDAIWPYETTFAEATRYFPAPLACLRTMKSDALVGLPRSRVLELDACDAAWRVNGRRGLFQVSDGAKR